MPLNDADGNGKGKRKSVCESVTFQKNHNSLQETVSINQVLDANYSSEENYQVLDDLRETQDKTIVCGILETTSSDLLIEPKCGMEYSTIDEMFEFWKNYANKTGFPVRKRSSKKGDDGVTKFVCFVCGRSGASERKSSNHLKPQANMRTDCKVKFSARLVSENKWLVTRVILDHNHELSSSRVKYFHHNIQINAPAKRRLEINDEWIVPESQVRYDKLCQSFSKLAYLAAKDENATTNILEWIGKLSNELSIKSSTCATMEGIPTSHVEIYTTNNFNTFGNESRNMIEALITGSKVEPPSRRLKSTIPEKSGRENKNAPTQVSQAEEIIPSLGKQLFPVSSSTPEVHQLAKAGFSN